FYTAFGAGEPVDQRRRRCAAAAGDAQDRGVDQPGERRIEQHGRQSRPGDPCADRGEQSGVALANAVPAPEPPMGERGGADLAICGGACGGDLLFAEAALERQARLELYIPFEEPTFLAKSVDFAGRDWRRRYVAVRARAALHVMPVERGPTPEGEGSYERNNLWMLEAAMRFGAGKV